MNNNNNNNNNNNKGEGGLKVRGGLIEDLREINAFNDIVNALLAISRTYFMHNTTDRKLFKAYA